MQIDQQDASDPARPLIDSYMRSRGYNMPPTSPKKENCPRQPPAKRRRLERNTRRLGNTSIRSGSMDIDASTLCHLINLERLFEPDMQKIAPHLLCSLAAELSHRGALDIASQLELKLREILPNSTSESEIYRRLLESDNLTLDRVSAENIPKIQISQTTCDKVFEAVDTSIHDCLSVALALCAVIVDEAREIDAETREASEQTSSSVPYRTRALKITKSPSPVTCGSLSARASSFAAGLKNGLIIVADREPSGSGVFQRTTEPCTSAMTGIMEALHVALKPDSLKLIGNSAEITAVHFAGSSKEHVISSARDGAVKLFDLPTRKQHVAYHGHHSPVWSLTIDASNSRFATGSMDGVVRLFDFSQVFPLRLLANSASDTSCSLVAFSPELDGATILSSVYADGNLKIWDARTPLCIAAFSLPVGFFDSVFLCGSYAVCSSNSVLYQVDRRSNAVVNLTGSHVGKVNCLHMMSDSQLLAADTSGRTKVWPFPLTDSCSSSSAYYSAGLRPLDVACADENEIFVLGK